MASEVIQKTLKDLDIGENVLIKTNGGGWIDFIVVDKKVNAGVTLMTKYLYKFNSISAYADYMTNDVMDLVVKNERIRNDSYINIGSSNYGDDIKISSLFISNILNDVSTALNNTPTKRNSVYEYFKPIYKGRETIYNKIPNTISASDSETFNPVLADCTGWLGQNISIYYVDFSDNIIKTKTVAENTTAETIAVPFVIVLPYTYPICYDTVLNNDVWNIEKEYGIYIESSYLYYSNNKLNLSINLSFAARRYPDTSNKIKIKIGDTTQILQENQYLHIQFTDDQIEKIAKNDYIDIELYYKTTKNYDTCVTSSIYVNSIIQNMNRQVYTNIEDVECTNSYIYNNDNGNFKLILPKTTAENVTMEYKGKTNNIKNIIEDMSISESLNAITKLDDDMIPTGLDDYSTTLYVNDRQSFYYLSNYNNSLYTGKNTYKIDGYPSKTIIQDANYYVATIPVDNEKHGYFLIYDQYYGDGVTNKLELTTAHTKDGKPFDRFIIYDHYYALYNDNELYIYGINNYNGLEGTVLSYAPSNIDTVVQFGDLLIYVEYDSSKMHIISNIGDLNTISEEIKSLPKGFVVKKLHIVNNTLFLNGEYGGNTVLYKVIIGNYGDIINNNTAGEVSATQFTEFISILNDIEIIDVVEDNVYHNIYVATNKKNILVFRNDGEMIHKFDLCINYDIGNITFMNIYNYTNLLIGTSKGYILEYSLYDGAESDYIYQMHTLKSDSWEYCTNYPFYNTNDMDSCLAPYYESIDNLVNYKYTINHNIPSEFYEYIEVDFVNTNDLIKAQMAGMCSETIDFSNYEENMIIFSSDKPLYDIEVILKFKKYKDIKKVVY